MFRFLGPLCLLLVTAVGCRDSVDSGSSSLGSDAGGATSCSGKRDCRTDEVCVAGVCQFSGNCLDSEACGDGQKCHPTRNLCVECVTELDCVAGLVCGPQFTCEAATTDAGTNDSGPDGCSGSCVDRSACADHLVCREGTCCPPPGRCLRPEDCPRTNPECNATTGVCFGGEGCIRDGDCAASDGCAGGICECVIERGIGTCRAKEPCARDEDCQASGMFSGKYCVDGAIVPHCMPAPECVEDIDCAPLGLICDETLAHCQNGDPCDPSGPEPRCAGDRLCVDGRCYARSCLVADLCDPVSERCNPQTARCERLAGGDCIRDEDCASDEYCNLQVSPAQCQEGCRDDTSCPTGWTCSPSRECVPPAGDVCSECVDSNECPTGTACRDNLLFGRRCWEPCGNDCALTREVNLITVCLPASQTCACF